MHYLDNSATTKPSDIAKKALQEAAEIWGNPSSVYTLGLEAKKLLEDSRRRVARTFGMPKFSEDRVYFTSSGTESNNIALLGCVGAKKRTSETGGTVIISAGEHPSVDEGAKLLESEGFDVVRIPTAGGRLDLGFLTCALDNAKSPVLFAGFMLVNNETGAIYDVKAASDLVKAKFPDANVHCDAVQGYMKLKISPKTLGVDTMTVSAHKIHSFRGAAALYVSGNVIKRKNLVPVMPGGGQEWGLRSGTENLCAIAAFAAAAEDGFANFAVRAEKVRELRQLLEKQFCERLEPLGVKQNRPESGVDGIFSLSLPQIRSETMLNFLSAREIYVSAGSACAANSKKKSAALTAFGCTPDEMDCALRISFDETNTAEDITKLCGGLCDGIRSLQRKR